MQRHLRHVTDEELKDHFLSLMVDLKQTTNNIIREHLANELVLAWEALESRGLVTF